MWKFLTVVGEFVLVENSRGGLTSNIGDEDAVNDDILGEEQSL